MDKVLRNAPSERQGVGDHKIDLLLHQERHANLLDLEVRDESVHIWFGLVCQFIQVHGPVGSFDQNDYNVDEFRMAKGNQFKLLRGAGDYAISLGYVLLCA